MDEQFDGYVRAALPELLRFGRALAGNPHDGADLVQGALESTGRRWRRLRAGEDITAYVKRAMVNAHISRWRRLRREWLTGNNVDALDATVDDVRIVEDPMWSALSALPPRQRAVLVLRYYEDLSELEIADVLGCAPGTVKSQASKGLATLRRQLGNHHDLPEEREPADDHA